MTQEMLIMAAILVAVILLTFIGILSRYRKCKSDEVLVVYGKTGGETDRSTICPKYPCGRTDHHHRSDQHRPGSDAKRCRTYAGTDDGRQTKPDY